MYSQSEICRRPVALARFVRLKREDAISRNRLERWERYPEEFITEPVTNIPHEVIVFEAPKPTRYPFLTMARGISFEIFKALSPGR